MIAHAIGAHIVEPVRASGMSPPMVVSVVRTIGTKRVSPACWIASITESPSDRS